MLHRLLSKAGCGVRGGFGTDEKDGEERPAKRLGKRELGSYAYEAQMPARLLSLLQSKDKGSEDDPRRRIVPALARLCERDRGIANAYLCDPAVPYISKIEGLRGEGNSFCGYRNIQMIVKNIIDTKAQGYEEFPNGVPSILDIQDLIEKAWDTGINADGRVQTGGIRGTRKYVGTPEVQALFRSLNIPCRVDVLKDNKYSSKACEELLNFVEKYFISPSSPPPSAPSPKVVITNFLPIYLQRPRHSMTIVGIEIRKDGERNLLVFDPGYQVSKDMRCYIEGSIDGPDQDNRAMSNPYRRGEKELGRYKAFETLKLIGAPQPVQQAPAQSHGNVSTPRA